MYLPSILQGLVVEDEDSENHLKKLKLRNPSFKLAAVSCFIQDL